MNWKIKKLQHGEVRYMLKTQPKLISRYCVYWLMCFIDNAVRMWLKIGMHISNCSQIMLCYQSKVIIDQF
jgi:hypothetical protein